MQNKIDAIIDRTLDQVLAAADSDVEAGPLHEPIIREALRRLHSRGLRVTRKQVAERLHVVLGGEP